MWKIHRYYLKEIVVNAVLTFAVLFGIALVSLLYKGIKMVQGGDLFDAALSTLLYAADIFPHLLTFSMMFGTVLAFARASQEREITAIRALGISPRVPMVAALLVGLGCSVVSIWALHYQIPWAHYHKYRVVADIYRSKIQDYLRNQDRIVLDNDGVMTWQSKSVEPETGEDIYNGVSIYYGEESHLSGLVGEEQSSTGSLITARQVRFEIELESNNVTMLLTEPYLPATDTRMGNPRITVNLVDMLKGSSKEAGDKDLRSDFLLSEVYRGAHPDPLAARYMVHRRASFALIPFLLAPIGFCIGVFSRERGRALALSFCMIPIALIYLVDFLGETALKHVETPWIGWLPSVAITVGGLPFCWRLLRV